MATTQYYAWDRAGRPITPCRPIRETVERLRLAFPRAAKANLISWHADDAHYQANRPQDHTPYSYTPWPVSPNPYPYVFATDVMHRPDLGVDCNELFAYWLAEAKAGLMPWLKYLIWQAKIYDVRNGWSAGKATGHFDHIHVSTRTDHIETSLGVWKLVPGEETDMTPQESTEAYVNAWRVYGQQMMADPIVIPANAGRGVPARIEEPNLLARALKAAGGEPSPEYLAAIEEAAERGAKEGAEAGAPTAEELESAAFEGAQRAERE